MDQGYFGVSDTPSMYQVLLLLLSYQCLCVAEYL